MPTHRTPTRVVITGMGMITPLALDVEETWQKLLAGCSGVSHLDRFDASELRTHFAGQVRGFDPQDYMSRKDARRYDLYIQFAMAASKEAIEQSGLDFEQEDRDAIGVILSTGIGGVKSIVENKEVADEKGLRRISPFLITNMLADSASGKIALDYGLRGPNHAILSACASGTTAVGEGFELLRRGDAEVMIVGGSEACLDPVIIGGFDVTGALSQCNEDPATACRPFDATRDGFVMGEGAATVVLETEEHAKARGATIYAEVIGYGNTADAHDMTAPHSEGLGAIGAMKMALRKAAQYGVQPQDIDYINAHGTSTVLNDKIETLAIKEVLGEHAYNLKVSSTKSMTGHLLGATGVLEAIFCAKAIETGDIPPTINLEHPDPECDLDYTPNRAAKADVRVALSNSFGFGGHNATVVLRRYEG